MKKHRRIHVISSWRDGPIRYLLRQLAATVLCLSGAVISIPGIPGPGFLLVMCGVLLLSFPGKLKLVHWLATKKAFRYLRVCLRKRFLLTMVMPGGYQNTLTK